MKKLTYYVACSVDGYIADSNGDVSWLDMIDLEKDDHGFNAFYDEVDSLIMGFRTYQQIVDFGDWPYPGKPCWVLSNSPAESEFENVSIVSQTPRQLLADLRQQGYNSNWLVGGGTLAQSFHDAELIDDYVISMIPYLLGQGIHLLGDNARAMELELIDSLTHSSGVVQMRYRRQKA